MNELFRAQGASSVRLSVDLYVPSLKFVEERVATVKAIASEINGDGTLHLMRALDELEAAINAYRVDCVKAITALFV